MKSTLSLDILEQIVIVIVIAGCYRRRGITIVELSLTNILMIRPQYQKIVRRTVAHHPHSQ